MKVRHVAGTNRHYGTEFFLRGDIALAGKSFSTLCNLKVHYSVNNPVNTLISCLLKNHYNIVYDPIFCMSHPFWLRFRSISYVSHFILLDVLTLGLGLLDEYYKLLIS